MPVPVRHQDRIESFRRPGDEVDALGLEQRAVVLLRQSQRRRRRVDVDAAGDLALADELQPVEPVPVKICSELDFVRGVAVLQTCSLKRNWG